MPPPPPPLEISAWLPSLGGPSPPQPLPLRPQGVQITAEDVRVATLGDYDGVEVPPPLPIDPSKEGVRMYSPPLREKSLSPPLKDTSSAAARAAAVERDGRLDIS